MPGGGRSLLASQQAEGAGLKSGAASAAFEHAAIEYAAFNHDLPGTGLRRCAQAEQRLEHPACAQVLLEVAARG